MDQERFERVWQRVRSGREGAATAQPGSERERLERLIVREERIEARYRRLRVRGSGSCRREAELGAREAEKRLNDLQAEYFLRYGDNYRAVWLPLPEAPGVLTALREIYLEETQGAAAYRETAETDQEEGVRRRCLLYAEERERRAAAVRRLIAGAIR